MDDNFTLVQCVLDCSVDYCIFWRISRKILYKVLT